MIKPKFTPGPWCQDVLLIDGRVTIGARYAEKTICDTLNDTISPVEHEANAYLIETAPDMYTVLEMVVAAHRKETFGELNHPINMEEAVLAALEVLKKARGE